MNILYKLYMAFQYMKSMLLTHGIFKYSISVWEQGIEIVRYITCFSGYLEEGIDPTLSIVALRGQGGDVVPAHGFDDVHHGLGLVGIRRHHSGEELIAAVVT